jgi:DNA-binding NarL/FixJ family response regulator
VRALLRRAGIATVAEAADAEQALALAEEHRPDLVLLDVAMPGRSGLEILPDLARLLPDASIVVLSNFPRDRLGGVAIQRGAVGYVEKRVPPERLVDEILVAAAVGAVATEHVSTALPASPLAPRAARAVVRELIGPEHASLLESVQLLVSELVTNAVVHANSAPRIEVDVGRERIRVAVFDDDPTLPATRPPDEERPGGRGLHLVQRIAERWAAEPHGTGKVVWFELARPG